MSLRQAITGRARPSELAWGLAIGLAIGLVPKGNLISLVLIGTAVSMRINHGMVALAAVGFSFLAVQFDPLTHEIGAGILQAPQTRQTLDRLWDSPLVPWTDLNNTVVMGSSVVALAALLPTYLVTLPLFRWLAPRKEASEENESATELALQHATPVAEVANPVTVFPTAGQDRQAEPAADKSLPVAQHTETQIDIIRLAHPIEDENEDGEDAGKPKKAAGSMNEALGYLLRRLRDSRHGEAA